MVTAFSRRGLTAIVLFLALVIVGPAQATEENLNDDGLALHGYDPVSYFSADNPVLGLEKFNATHHGALYLFASLENRDRFVANPDKFAPQFGGYCAYGVRVGRKFDIDPDVYRVVDGKLYVQLNWGTQVIWLANMTENIEVAHRLWPMIKPKSDQQLAAAEKSETQPEN
jgi:hypothetical protein